MTLRRLAVLQWVGLLAGAAAWAAQFLAGYWITAADCGRGGSRLANDPWQAGLMAVGALCVVAAEAVAITVVRRTRATSYATDGPPLGRIRFLALAAVAANAAFLMIILLSGIAALAAADCRQA